MHNIGSGFKYAVSSEREEIRVQLVQEQAAKEGEIRQSKALSNALKAKKETLRR